MTRLASGTKRMAMVAVGLGAQLVCAAPGFAQGTRLPWSSTFDAGTFAEWDGFRNDGNAVITDQGCQSGRCLRNDMVPGVEGEIFGDYHFGDFVTVRGPKVEEVWLRFYSRFDEGFTGNKIAIVNLTDGTNYTKHYQVFVHADGPVYMVQHSYTGGQWLFFNLPQNIGTPVALRRGQWDKLKLYVRLNTPGQSNGIVRFWVNDQLKAEHTSVDIRENTSYGLNKLNLSTAQPGNRSTIPGTQWHDSFTISATDPDAGQSTAPSPPTGVRITSP